MTKKIMVIDDEASMGSILKQMLEKEGYTAMAFTSGPEAIENFKQDHYDLVISDVAMPSMTGVEILSQIKEARPKTPVVFVTAQNMDEILNEAIQLGLDGYIEKPFNVESVFEVVKEKLTQGNES